MISNYFEYENQNLSIDVSLHIGSFFAVSAYFYKEILNFFENKLLFLKVFISSFPVMIVGFLLLKTGIIDKIRDLETIAWTTLIFGILLFYADKFEIKKSFSYNLNLKNILFIGLFQILALIPGVSRSGITITAGRLLNFNRFDSSKIAFLLSVPALAGASLLGLKDIWYLGFDFSMLVLFSTICSFVFSYLTIKYFLIYVKKFNLTIFVIYRILLSLFLFFIIYI